jgi:hypothetical protein
VYTDGKQMLRRVLVISGYVFLTLAVVVLTFVLVAYGNDYTYDFGTHRVVQKGHVIINSLPSGVQVTADGKALRKKTPYQAAYSVGRHTFELGRDGYMAWSRTMDVVAGQVSLARYVILMPLKPVTQIWDTRPQIIAQSISKDHRHLVYVTAGPDAAVYTLDLGNPKPFKLYTPRAASGTTPAETVREAFWSDDASHVMVVTDVGGVPTHRLVNGGGGEVINLTEQYRFNFTGIKFGGGDWRQLYWLAPEGLRRLDAGAQTVSAVLADKVQQFWVTPDRVLYVQQTDLGRSLWSLDRNGHHQELIQALPESDRYALAYSNFQGSDVLAVVPAKTGIGTLYVGIFGDTPVAKTVAHGVTDVSFSPDGHLAAFTSPTSMVVYDLQRSNLEDRSVVYTSTEQPGELQNLSWFDDYHVLMTRSGKAYFAEYDGANRVELGAAAGGFPAYSSSDEREIILFKNDGAAVRIANIVLR